MLNIDLKNLIAKCSPQTLKAIEGASGMCLSRTQYELTPEHVLLQLLDPPSPDLEIVLHKFEADPSRLLNPLIEHIESLRVGSTARPKLSTDLVEVLQNGWMISSVEMGQTQIRTGGYLLAYLAWGESKVGEPYVTVCRAIPAGELRKHLSQLLSASKESLGGRAPGETAAGLPVGQGEEALKLYCIDVTERARSGELDPIFGREEEIRRSIDILMRRKKNNPILVGEPGVGKTALVEGLALRIAEGHVPDFLKETRIISLDIGLLQAGAGVKGEFENRLKAVITAIKGSADPIISFIDEAHTLIGAGGPAGGSDAANLLKPALARGELRTVAATTWSEYKKYFEKDPALARRFELVRVDEPDEEKACGMLRGLREKYETSHNVTILDESIVASVQLSSRYLTGRFLPDKAEGLLDTAAARVKVSQSCKPAALQDLEATITGLEIEMAGRRRDAAYSGQEEGQTLVTMQETYEALKKERDELHQNWQTENDAVQEVARCREGEGSGNGELAAALAKLKEIQGNDPLVPLEVNQDVVAAVVADWTGIPAGKMVRDEAEAVLHFEDRMKESIRGQDHAVAAVGKAVRMAKAGVGRPEAPTGVFLFVGPSGVGKTECGRAIADQLFGGEKSIVSINMSEYMEKHTVSRLIGSPPGYVGYGEGGVLTEAVRQRPYSLVLLDEVEKAHPDVLNIFYQIFDRGMCNDGEGREINFRETVIIMTSNLGLDDIQELCSQPELPEPEEVLEQIRPVLREHFKPALLARFQTHPFYPLSQEVMQDIARIKLSKVTSRLQDSMGITCEYASEIPQLLAERCHVSETGARALDQILEDEILPTVSTELLTRMSMGTTPSGIRIVAKSDGEFGFEFKDE